MTGSLSDLPLWPKVMRLLATALLLGLAISQVIAYALPFNALDATSYSWAGEAWATTGSPYTEHPNVVNGNPMYRYAPWFAVPWIVLYRIPYIEQVWALLMAGCAVIAVVPMFREYGAKAIPLGGFMLGWLLAIGLNGNVQPAMIALLVWTLPNKWGPVGIAVAASLKATPMLFAVVYAARGEWRNLAVTLGLTALLVAPMLLFHYPHTEPGQTYSLLAESVVLWGAVTAVVGVAAWRLARTRYAWLGAAALVCVALPRAHFYDITYLLAGHTSKVPENER